MPEHQLRDLARRLVQLTEAHPAYAQATAIVQNCADHLCAVARAHEGNAELEAMCGLLDKAQHEATQLVEKGRYAAAVEDDAGATAAPGGASSAGRGRLPGGAD